MSDEIRSAIEQTLRGVVVRNGAGEWDQQALRSAFDALARQGWTGVGLDESLGGSGGDLADAASVVAAATYCATPTPLPDLVLVANQVAQRLRISLGVATGCVVPVISNGARTVRVPWASWATELLVVDESGVRQILPGSARLTPGRDLAGLPTDEVELAENPTTDGSPGLEALALARQLGALARAIQLSAATRRSLDLSITHTRVRRQFGRPLSELPVVQHELAELAGEAEAAQAATDAAVRIVAADTLNAVASGRIALSDHAFRAVATAKIRAGMSAMAGARIAHQLHGAMGITREYELQAHTRSIWTWCDEYGGQRQWSTALGMSVRDNPKGLWPVLADLD